VLSIVLVSAVLLAPSLATAQDTTEAVVAWFTDSTVPKSVRTAKPVAGLPEAPGTAGKGVVLSRSAAIENPLLKQDNGLITFWIKPNWNGNDGKTHRILTIGDPATNGLLVEKSDKGMLRYVMASPTKVTAARADVSNWKAGQWHHVAIAWMSVRGKPLGLPLWIDKWAVAGPIFGGSEFMNPDKMADKRVIIGDATSDCVIDELIMRDRFDTEGPHGQIATVYRDFFRSAPYTRVAIDLRPMYGPMDPRVVIGCEKQYGLMAEMNGVMTRVTDFAVRYGQWSEFDAKPFIKWTTSDPKIATVNANGRVTGKSLGKCTLTAEFRGMKATYQLEVIPIEQPDLDLVYVERFPKYKDGDDKDRPSPGEKVRFVARIINFGYKTAPAGVEVVFELIPDSNNNLRLDRSETPIATQRKVISKALKPREEESVEFDWTWSDDPIWVRVTVDPANKIAEICEANNERCEMNIARALHMGYDPAQLEDFYNNRKINHVGSFSEYDWINGQLYRFEALLRQTVLPTTSPDGVRETLRNDKTYALKLGDTRWEDEPWEKEGPYYDGGFPVREPIDLMAIDAAILHEFGHTCVALPDLYGYPVNYWSVLLKDENGKPYAGSELMPLIRDRDNIVPLSSANGVPCGVSYDSLMNHCHMWLHPAHAGEIQYFAGYRGNRFWGIQGRLIPAFENWLKIYDINDQPLSGAAVYVYHVINTSLQDAGTKYFPDRPKFVGNTDKDGRWRFPNETDRSWDDPDTDEVDGSISVWNPFGRVKTDTAFTPNVWTVEGLLLIKIVSGNQTEFYWMSLTEFNEQFFKGNKNRGVYHIRTSLQPSNGITRVVRPEIPESIRKTNLKPVAVVTPQELTVKCNEEFTLDGSKSYDPEGQPLTYRWGEQAGWLKPDLSTDSTCTIKAPGKPGEVRYRLYVIDGLRVSEPVSIKVNVVE